jgi:hypothetical protein
MHHAGVRSERLAEAEQDQVVGKGRIPMRVGTGFHVGDAPLPVAMQIRIRIAF